MSLFKDMFEHVNREMELEFHMNCPICKKFAKQKQYGQFKQKRKLVCQKCGATAYWNGEYWDYNYKP